MKKTLILFVLITLAAPVALADPPATSGLVVRDNYGSWAWMWGETGPSLLMGITFDDAYAICTGECAIGSDECPFANIDRQWVQVPGVDPWTQTMNDAPAVLLQNPNPYPPFWGICDFILLGKLAEGRGNWRDTWTGVVCPETEQRSWSAHGVVTSNGETPVTLNVNATYHCVLTCGNGFPTCRENVRLSERGGN